LTETKNRFARFLVAGGVNTAVTYLGFLLLAPRIGHLIGYTLVYSAGILLAYCLNALFVFRTEASWRTALPFPMVYGVQYFWGLLLMYLLVDFLGWRSALAMLVVIVTSVPITFLLTRYLMAK
jgi:putative flippase GtrA